jgi:hypothetical protein
MFINEHMNTEIILVTKASFLLYARTHTPHVLVSVAAKLAEWLRRVES